MARTRRQQQQETGEKEEPTPVPVPAARDGSAAATRRRTAGKAATTTLPATAAAGSSDGSDAVKQEEEEDDEEEDEEEEEQAESASGSADGMTEYERKRLENIQRNLDFMRSMGVSTAKIAARTAASVPAHLQKGVLGAQRGISTKRRPSDKPVAPMRKSRRLEGKQADDIAMRDDLHAMSVAQLQREREREPARFGALLDAEPLNLDGAQGQQLLSSIVGEYEEDEEREEDLRVDASGVDVVRYALRERDVVKAVEERVYSLAFHPRSDRAVVACGDKRGNVALWDADAPEDSDDSVVAMYRPHTLPTTQLHFQPGDATKLLSASFDGTVRQFDLKAAKFTELFATPDHTGITSLATTTERATLLASGDDGHVWSIDTRQAPAAHTAYVTHEKKVQTVHQHPLIDFCFATASLDRTVCLWDIRKLSAKSTASKPLVTMPHHRSVNCAYFSPTGRHLVTVGQDDYIHVYDTQDATHLNTADVKPTLRIPHNNQTGRWLTKFHAAWDPKRPDEYVIGCMQQPRRIQIFKATRKSPIQELQSEYVASVHSINVFHPTLPLVAGGNSSGRLCLFRGEASGTS